MIQSKLHMRDCIHIFIYREALREYMLFFSQHYSLVHLVNSAEVVIDFTKEDRDVEKKENILNIVTRDLG